MTEKPDIIERCTEYLSLGGFFNPELMPADKVRDIVIDCRDELTRLRAREAELVEALKALHVFHDYPTEAKRPDVFEKLIRRARALTAQQEGDGDD